MSPLRHHRARPARRCPCGCGHIGFCGTHEARLAQIREQFNLDGKRVSDRGGHKRAPNRRGSAPTCCRPGCMEPRVPPEPFCDGCQAAGFVQQHED